MPSPDASSLVKLGRVLLILVAWTSGSNVFALENTEAPLRSEVAANPKAAPQIIARALQSAGEAAPRKAGPITAEVITGLGVDPSAALVGRTVNSAVSVLPDSAIEIVRAAVTVAPAEAADEIVAAALSALPDPWKVVMYQRISVPAKPFRRGEPDYKGGPDFKGEPDYKEPARGLEGVPMTMAEAILQAALDARPELGAAGLYAVAESVLRRAPGWLVTAIYDPKGISGVGDAGLNNYANEPLRPRPRVLAPVPEPDPVSP